MIDRKRLRELADKILSRTRLVNDCLIWTGAKTSSGYGSIKAFGRTQKTHRLILAERLNAWPLKGLACHSCDEPLCVNPMHLFLGTHKDNAQDCARKGRQSLQNDSELAKRIRSKQIGSKSPKSKLIESDIMAIRSAACRGESRSALAKKYGVDPSNISLIYNGRTWKHVGGPIRINGHYHPRAREALNPKGSE